MNTIDKILHAVVIGGGQAGLATGYFLKKMNSDFVILEKNLRIGDSWRNRWDSLLLFTPSQHDHLPGMDLPVARGLFPAKDQIADYLELYADKFSLPVELNTTVRHLSKRGKYYEISTNSGMVFCENVVIATGTHPVPYIPAMATGLSTGIFQIHSSHYRNPSSLPDGDVLVVGAGTSGIEIALEVSKSHRTFISGNPTFHIPDKVLRYGGELFWWFISNMVTIRTPIGKRVKQKITHSGSPLIRISAADLDKAGVYRLPRLIKADNGFPYFSDNSVLKVASVIWSTGYKPDYSWIEMKVTDDTGWPVTHRGVSSNSTGLCFVGMPFQYGLTSGLIGGVSRDAEYVSRHILKNNHRGNI